MCMVERRPANLATVFALSMKRLWRGGAGARIYCGPYVTWLAESLGVFQRYPADRMKEGPDPCFMSVRDLQSAGILAYTDPISWEPIREGPQVQPPPGSGAAEAMQGAIGGVRKAMEAGQRRLEDGMRVLMQNFHLQPPPSWRQTQAGPSGMWASDEEQWNQGESDDED
ncbi:hypothetical protein HanXRQr2_Chr10g0429931 [Helianthus annuus]|uniref:Uncharacterized protein n=1 Tax=Helianthus annuus TaxID=4232 RepID=A0A9K3HWE6_HELAN|nr:hypothetical protein HanXRQr2_Chr10g0429931 [Helianthus annuus]KAJ0513060.1 hypothetical protein HanHA300_Chr10g0353181 [Helianthus annuus]KAJ0696096.1 hypothetical protein HanLR1_Chr10g0353061 [Helianthus annuus]